jgi:pyrroloquinoline-quinone synthase
VAVDQPLTREEFRAALHGLSAQYWTHHPFHTRLHAGGCAPDEIRLWVANRWYYQRHLSQKNAAIIANCPLPEVRSRWVRRILFQDGDYVEGERDGEGGLGDWLVLGEAVGLSRTELLDERHVRPGVRFAVDGYVAFCRNRPWTEGAAATLTELFSPDLMSDRVRAWQQYYTWIKPDGFAYFDKRIPVVRGDSGYTLDLVLTHCVSRSQQDAAVAALGFKCDVLWAMLDAIDYPGAVNR